MQHPSRGKMHPNSTRIVQNSIMNYSSIGIVGANCDYDVEVRTFLNIRSFARFQEQLNQHDRNASMDKVSGQWEKTAHIRSGMQDAAWTWHPKRIPGSWQGVSDIQGRFNFCDWGMQLQVFFGCRHGIPWDARRVWDASSQ